MLQDGSWDETSWEWNKAMEAIKDTYKIVEPSGAEDIAENIIELGDNPLSSDKIEVGISYYKDFLKEIVKLLKDGGKTDADALKTEIDELVTFELKLDTFTRQYRKLKKNKSIKITPTKAFKSSYKKIIWMNFFQPFILSNATDYEGQVDASAFEDFSKFLQETPKK